MNTGRSHTANSGHSTEQTILVAYHQILDKYIVVGCRLVVCPRRFLELLGL